MIRIRRLQITYVGLPIDRRRAALVARQAAARLNERLENRTAPQGTLGRLVVPSLRISPGGLRGGEIGERCARAIDAEMTRSSERKGGA